MPGWCDKVLFMKQKECEEHKSEAYIGGGGYTEGEREWFAKVCSFERLLIRYFKSI